jgi:hypothetical protein
MDMYPTIIPKGTIIAGFAGIGKTTASLKYDNVIDLESSNYFFDLPENLTIDDYEKLKGDASRVPNPNGLSKYVDAIINAQKKYDYVFIALFPALIQELNQRNIDVQIVLPDISDKVHYKRRYKDRGNQQSWIDNMVTSWDDYLNPDSPKFITNSLNLKNSMKEPIILQTLNPTSEQFAVRESLSSIIAGNMRFKPEYLIKALKTSVKDIFDIKINHYPAYDSYIVLNYLFDTLPDGKESYHQITIDLTPLANQKPGATERDVEIILEKIVNHQTDYNDFAPRYRYFKINSDNDLDKLVRVVTTLVFKDVHFTRTLDINHMELL